MDQKTTNTQNSKLDSTSKVERISEEDKANALSANFKIASSAELNNSYNFDIYYAEAWSKKQGHFSYKLANNLINYLKEKRKKINSVLDICSGSGEFLSVIRNICTKCVGVDNSESYLEYVRSNIRDVEFIKVDKFESFDLKQKFDFISCNRDVINMFERFGQWEEFFANVYKHLKPNGIFLFDFYTEDKLKNWNTTIFDQSDEIDYVSKIYQHQGKCVFNEVYYLKQSSSYYRKTSDIMVEAYFPTSKIFKAIENAGFSGFEPVDIEFNRLINLDGIGRIHILAVK